MAVTKHSDRFCNRSAVFIELGEILKNVIIVVSVSQGDPDSGISRLQQKIASTYSQEKVLFAYTGSHILKQHPECSLQAVLRAIQKDGFCHIVVVPLYLLTGNEYQKVRRQLCGEKATILPLPFQQKKNCVRLVQAFADHFPVQEGKGWVFVGHGSKEDEQFYKDVQGLFDEQNRKDCFVTTLLDPDALSKCTMWAKNENKKALSIVPLMLGSGKHIQKDIFSNETGWKIRLEKAGFDVDAQKLDVGSLQIVQRLYLQEIESALR